MPEKIQNNDISGKYSQIIASWGKPRGKKESEVYSKMTNILYAYLQGTENVTLEGVLLDSGISIGSFSEWKEKYRDKKWFQRAIQDVQSLQKENILRKSKLLGSEVVKMLIEGEKSDENIVKIEEYVQIVNQ